MPGFRYCQWCSGKGCIACDAEKKKWEQSVADRAPSWRSPDIRDVRDAVIESELARGFQPGLAVDASGRIDAFTPAEVEEALKPLLDAEYARQFPNGPEPMLVVRRDNPDDMELLKKVFHREAIEHAFGPDGGGMEEIEKNAADARAIQAAREKPNP